jgi:hypothetical protein
LLALITTIYYSFGKLVFPVSLGLLAVVISDDGLATWGPFGRAHLTILLNELECLHKSQDFINVSTDWCVVNAGVFEDSLSINNESASQ